MRARQTAMETLLGPMGLAGSADSRSQLIFRRTALTWFGQRGMRQERQLSHASTGIDRPAGFDRYREAGTDILPRYLVHSGLDSAGGHRAADRLLDLDPQPTALFAVNDFAAIGAAGAHPAT